MTSLAERSKKHKEKLYARGLRLEALWTDKEFHPEISGKSDFNRRLTEELKLLPDGERLKLFQTILRIARGAWKKVQIMDKSE